MDRKFSPNLTLYSIKSRILEVLETIIEGVQGGADSKSVGSAVSK
jgi:hypothetical protein